jgi:ATP-dependent exoDNAse (exonuclease V) beta subunit
MAGNGGTPTSSFQPSVAIETVERRVFERPGGRRFGTLVHAVLASIDLNADTAAVRAAALVEARILAATEEEIASAVAIIGNVLQHPILRRAAAVKVEGLRREAPVLLTLDGGSVVEGVIDLAFRDNTPEFVGWTVVDFKTDREFAAMSAQYITQVGTYVEAVTSATGSPARGIVLVL